LKKQKKKKLYIAGLLLSSFIARAAISVESGFEGGNGRIVSADPEANRVTVEAERKLDDSQAIHFYFRIDGFDTDRPLEIAVRSAYPPKTATYSHDGRIWYRLPSSSPGVYRLPFPRSPVYLASGYPYSWSQMVRFVKRSTSGRRAAERVIGKSDGGRSIHALVIPPDPPAGRDMLFIIGRQHGYESLPSWIIEGMVEFLTSDDPFAKDFRERHVAVIVPMADVDAVAEGATGKDRSPSDWNRSWHLEPAPYRGLQAIRGYLAKMARRHRLQVFADVHAMGYQNTHPRYGLFLFNVHVPGTPAADWIDRMNERFRHTSGYELYYSRFEGSLRVPGLASSHVSTNYPAVKAILIVEATGILRPDGWEWSLGRLHLAGSDLARAIIGGFDFGKTGESTGMLREGSDPSRAACQSCVRMAPVVSRLGKAPPLFDCLPGCPGNGRIPNGSGIRIEKWRTDPVSFHGTFAGPSVCGCRCGRNFCLPVSGGCPAVHDERSSSGSGAVPQLPFAEGRLRRFRRCGTARAGGGEDRRDECAIQPEEWGGRCPGTCGGGDRGRSGFAGVRAFPGQAGSWGDQYLYLEDDPGDRHAVGAFVRDRDRYRGQRLFRNWLLALGRPESRTGRGLAAFLFTGSDLATTACAGGGF
jgi:hypothetical protein